MLCFQGHPAENYDGLKVFPIDDPRKKIWESSLLMGFSELMARKWTTEERVLENSKKQGYTHMLKIQFEIKVTFNK